MLHRYLRCAASLTAVVGQANEDEEENGSNDHDGDDNTCNRHASTPCYMLEDTNGVRHVDIRCVCMNQLHKCLKY